MWWSYNGVYWFSYSSDGFAIECIGLPVDCDVSYNRV